MPTETTSSADAAQVAKLEAETSKNGIKHIRNNNYSIWWGGNNWEYACNNDCIWEINENKGIDVVDNNSRNHKQREISRQSPTYQTRVAPTEYCWCCPIRSWYRHCRNGNKNRTEIRFYFCLSNSAFEAPRTTYLVFVASRPPKWRSFPCLFVFSLWIRFLVLKSFSISSSSKGMVHEWTLRMKFLTLKELRIYNLRV